MDNGIGVESDLISVVVCTVDCHCANSINTEIVILLVILLLLSPLFAIAVSIPSRFVGIVIPSRFLMRE